MLRVGLLFAAACHLADALTKPISVERHDGDLSGGDEWGKSTVSCPTSAPTLTSCGLIGDDVRLNGLEALSGECEATKGYGNSGAVRAVAMCTDSSISCTDAYYSWSAAQQSGNDASATCSNNNELMVSCSAFSPWKAIDGAYIGTSGSTTDPITSSTPCVARRAGTGSKVSASGVCCRYTGSDGYELQCKTAWGSTASNGATSSVGCSGTDYTVMACGAYSAYDSTIESWYYDPSDNKCKATFDNKEGRAAATCCRLYQAPTPSPTTGAPTTNPSSDPTGVPTANPSSDPTGVPSANPSSDPTGVPSANPSSDPTGVPSANPSSDPTNDPTEMPSAEPTTEPTLLPTTSPTLDGCDLDIDAYLSECYCESTMARLNLDSAHSNREQQQETSLNTESLAGATSEADWQLILLAVVVVQNALLIVLGCYSLRAKTSQRAGMTGAHVRGNSMEMSTAVQFTATPSE